MTKDSEIEKPDGNDFQYKVKKVLVDQGWNVRMSPHYNDSFSEKPREIDMIAEKVFLSSQQEFYQGTVIVRLFVECKYIAEQTTFWFEEKNLDNAKKVVDSTRSFHEANRNHEVMTNHHYLLNNLVAKLYSSDLKKRIQNHISGNGGQTTSRKRDWKLIYYESYLNKEDAIGREKFLKSGSGRKYLKKQLMNYLTLR